MIARDQTAAAELADADRSDVPPKADSTAAESKATGADSGPSPLDPLLRHLSELRMLVGHYLRAHADRITARIRSVLFWAIAGLIGLIVAVAFLVTAVVLMLRGIVAGLTLLGLQAWAAELLTGVACIAAVASTLAIVSFTQKKAARRKRHDDYEHFRARYRAKFGHGLNEPGRDGH